MSRGSFASWHRRFRGIVRADRPGLRKRELVAGEHNGKRTLTTCDGQHDYVFIER